MWAVARTVRRFCAIVCCIAFLMPAPARAVELNPGDIIVSGTEFSGHPTEVIYRVNPVTGEPTLISSMQYDLFDDSDEHGIVIQSPVVAVDSQRRLFAAGFAKTPSDSVLVTIDPATGNRTVVSDSSHGIGPNLNWQALHFAPDGTLFSYGEAKVAQSIVRIDTASGDRSYLPAATFDSAPLLGLTYGLAAAPNGDLWITSAFPDERVGILWANPETGEHGVGSSSGSPSGYPIVGTGPALTGTMNGLVSAPNGDLYVLQQSNVLRIDPITGNRELVTSWDPLDPLGNGPLIGTVGYGALAVEADGSLLALSGYGSGVLIRIDPITGDRSQIADLGTLGTEILTWSFAVVPHPVPEPSTLVLAGSAIIAFAVMRRRRRVGQGSP